MFRRETLFVATIAILFFSYFVHPTVAQEFEAGDQVIVKFGSRTFDGEIVDSVFSGKFYRVKHQRNGRERTSSFPVGNINKKLVTKQDDSSNLPKPRKWKSSNGKFEVNARLKEVVDGEVKLVTDDGRLLSVAIEKLSQVDQDHLQELESNENPFAGGHKIQWTDSASSASSKIASKPGSTISPSIKKNLIHPNPVTGKKIFLSPGSSYSVTPDAEIESSNFEMVATPISNGGHEKTFFNKSNALIRSLNGTTGGVSISNAFNKKFTSIELFDLKSGDSKSRFPVDGDNVRLVGIIRGDVETVLTLTIPFGLKPATLNAWQSENGQLKHVFGWEIKANDAQLISDDRLLTTDRDGHSIVWDLTRSSSVYYFDATRGVRPQLSQNRKQIAVVDERTICILNSESGKVEGSLKTAIKPTALAFSRNGAKFAVYDRGVLEIFDLASGEKLDHFYIQGSASTNRSLQWIDDDHLLVNGIDIVSVRCRVVVWRFRGAKISVPLTRVSGDTFCYFSKTSSGDGYLLPTRLPIAETLASTAAMDPDQLRVIQPGTPIKIDLQLPFDPKQNANIERSLIEKLESGGFVIEEDAAIVLKAYSKKGKPTQREYQKRPGFRRPFGATEKVAYTPTFCYLEFLKNGSEQLWRKSSTSAPSTLLILKEGETAQQAASRAAKPSPRFFTDTIIPGNLSKLPDGRNEIGTSELTPNGLR